MYLGTCNGRRRKDDDSGSGLQWSMMRPYSTVVPVVAGKYSHAAFPNPSSKKGSPM